MDTDYLTEKSYQLLLMASEVSHMLMVQQGVICTHSKDEDEFLKNVLEYFQEVEENPNEFIEMWEDEGEEIDEKKLLKVLRDCQTHAKKISAIPVEQRGKTREQTA